MNTAVPYKVSGIYQIKNTVTGDRYIGNSVDLRTRCLCHRSRLRTGKHCNPILLNAWNKYGEDNFEFQILLICSREDTIKYEQAFLDKTEHKYNYATHVSKPMLGKRLTEEHKRKISKAISGENNPNYGKKLPKWHKEKLRKSHLGKTLSAKTKYKMSESHKGIEFTEEHRENLSRASIGKVMSKEARKNMSDAQKGKVFSKETRRKLSEAKIGNTNGKSSWYKKGHEYQKHTIKKVG